VIVELKNSIKASVAVAGGGDELSASTNNSNPDTPHGLVIARTPDEVREHAVILHTPWELSTVDEPSLLTLTVLVVDFLIEINVEVATRAVRIRVSDKDVVSPAVFSDEGSIGAATDGGCLNNAVHLIAIVVNLNGGIESVELVASGSSDGLRVTEVSVTVPATTTRRPRTIARLIAGVIGGSVADENIREAVDLLSEPALIVLGILIRPNRKGEINTIDGWGSRRNSDEVRVRSSKEDNLSTKTAVIIVGSNALPTSTRMSGARVFALLVNIDDGIVDSRRASASGDNNLTVTTLKTEEHRVNTVDIAALRESGVKVIGLTGIVERKASDDDGLIAITVWVHCTLLDGKSETTTSVVVTSDEHVVQAVLNRAP